MLSYDSGNLPPIVPKGGSKVAYYIPNASQSQSRTPATNPWQRESDCYGLNQV